MNVHRGRVAWDAAIKSRGRGLGKFRNSHVVFMVKLVVEDARTTVWNTKTWTGRRELGFVLTVSRRLSPRVAIIFQVRYTDQSVWHPWKLSVFSRWGHQALMGIWGVHEERCVVKDETMMLKMIRNLLRIGSVRLQDGRRARRGLEEEEIEGGRRNEGNLLQMGNTPLKLGMFARVS